MAVYSYYYGASPNNGIGVQAQSKELEKLPIQTALKDLSSMHALESPEHSGEKLSYLLSVQGYSVLGVSYAESPKESGYNRSAACGLQYILPDAELAARGADLNKIVNFVSFQKPRTAAPAPVEDIPMNDSGYLFHHSPAVLMALVEGFLRAATSKDALLLVALPRSKNSEYAAARYAIAEALSCLPGALRPNIRFFTGLPVADGVADPLVGLNNAAAFGANVVFCPAEYYQQLKSRRTCIGVDMANPDKNVGKFAQLLALAPESAVALSMVEDCLGGRYGYNEINRAAENVWNGNIVTVESLRKELLQANEWGKSLEKKNAALNQEKLTLQKRYAALETENGTLNDAVRQLKAGHRVEAAPARQFQNPGKQAMPQTNWVQQEEDEEEETRKDSNSLISKLAIVIAVLLFLAMTAFTLWFFKDSLFPPKNDTPAPTAVVTQVPTSLPTEVPTELPDSNSEIISNPDELPQEGTENLPDDGAVG